MELSEYSSKKKTKNVLKYILLFILFLLIGFALGFYGTTLYLQFKEAEKEKNVDETEWPIDITNDEQSKKTIERLTGILNKDPIFYTTKGVNISTLDKNVKLIFLFDYINRANQGTDATLDIVDFENMTCVNGIMADELIEGQENRVCSVKTYDFSLFTEASKVLFNENELDTSINFSPEDGRSCFADTENKRYICGNVPKQTNITGKLESKFDVIKVTKDEDNTIQIYEKGYLNDKRSNVINSSTNYDNYYLHSSDSTNYYYELRSADNLTFRHTFKTNNGSDYYYVGTELFKE